MGGGAEAANPYNGTLVPKIARKLVAVIYYNGTSVLAAARKPVAAICYNGFRTNLVRI